MEVILIPYLQMNLVALSQLLDRKPNITNSREMKYIGSHVSEVLGLLTSGSVDFRTQIRI